MTCKTCLPISYHQKLNENTKTIPLPSRIIKLASGMKKKSCIQNSKCINFGKNFVFVLLKICKPQGCKKEDEWKYFIFTVDYKTENNNFI